MRLLLANSAEYSQIWRIFSRIRIYGLFGFRMYNACATFPFEYRDTCPRSTVLVSSVPASLCPTGSWCTRGDWWPEHIGETFLY